MTRSKGAVVLLLGGAIGGGATALVAPVAASAITVGLLAGVSLLLVVLGVIRLRAGDRQGDQAADYRHTYRLFVSIIALLLVAAGARELLQPKTFGEYGHFRGAAVATARQRPVSHQGNAACAECHDKRVKLHDKDAHTRVACETCHGAGAAHASYHRAHDSQGAKAAKGGAAPPASAKMIRPKGKAFCLNCHQLLAARPGDFSQIEWQEHFAFVGVKKAAAKDVTCTACHDPHEPLYMDRDLRQARLHPMIHRCRDCHSGPARDETMKRPQGHPVIFDCSYCHKQIASDFAGRKHHNVRCTTCHLFFRQGESAGRIIRDADPRFCLLCHRKASFRGDKAPPSIEWPTHREEMGEGPQDAQKRCIDCHQQEAIHRLRSEISNEGRGDAPTTRPK